MREHGPTHFGYIAGSGSDIANLEPGGLCFVAKAGAALNIGDTVIVHTDADEVTKVTTDASHVRRCGIVVGGTKTNMKALTESDAVGKAAALENEQVLVCYSGIAWGIAQPADVAVGDLLRPDTTTAGRLLDGTGLGTKAVGIALSASTAAGDPIKVLVALS